MNLLLRLLSPRAVAAGLTAWLLAATLTVPKRKNRPASDDEPLGI